MYTCFFISNTQCYWLLCRTVCLVVDLSNRMKVFILDTLLLLKCNFKETKTVNHLMYLTFLKISKKIIESLFKINPFPKRKANQLEMQRIQSV